MEKNKIQERMKGVKSIKDLVKLLNAIKRDEFGTSKYKITEKQLLHFSNPTRKVHRYKTFFINKKSGGTREINAPCYQLSILLHVVNVLFKALYNPSKSAMGFVEGRSVVDNASVHVGNNYVFNMDLKDFFPSIPQARVWKRIQLPPFNFTQETANVIAGLCCYFDLNQNKCVLPQGAPTSPLLTNAICDKLDRRLAGVAKRFKVRYSRYADDITFSSMHNVYQENSDFRIEVKRVIADQGFIINDKKTRLQKRGVRQEVTGLTVNEKVNVCRQYISDLRWILNLWEKKGYAIAYSKFYPKYKIEKGHVKKGEPVMENVIGGKLDYLRMVKGANNITYKKLQERYDRLQQIFFPDSKKESAQKYLFVQTYSVTDFKKMVTKEITLIVSQNMKLTAKCKIGDKDCTLAITKSCQKVLCKDLDKRNIGDTIESKMLDKCYVSLCRYKTNNFWLISNQQHSRSKKLSLQNVRLSLNVLLKYWEIFGLEKTVQVISEAIMVHEINESFNDFSIINIDNYFIKELKDKFDKDNAKQKEEFYKRLQHKEIFRWLSEEEPSSELLELILQALPFDGMPLELQELITNTKLKLESDNPVLSEDK